MESQRLGRKAFGFDVDPLSVLLTKANTRIPKVSELWRAYNQVVSLAQRLVRREYFLKREFERRVGKFDRRFLKFWFPLRSRKELLALAISIERVVGGKATLAAWLRAMFSSIIITKESGASFARDLSHSRPHRSNEKHFKTPLALLDKRFGRVLDQMAQARVSSGGVPTKVGIADCRKRIPLGEESVDLVVTSPPYATAIDYLRSHKFSLIWMGYSLLEIADIRKKHIGSRRDGKVNRDCLPVSLRRKIRIIANSSRRQARALEWYFADLRRTLKEIYRVLKPGAALVMVVGPCFSNGNRVETHRHVLRLMRGVGFKACGWARREINRDRRMLPVSANGNGKSRIERRIHREYLVGAIKPPA